eukprot:6925775-Pyramimonas_sp.AAC.1
MHSARSSSGKTYHGTCCTYHSNFSFAVHPSGHNSAPQRQGCPCGELTAGSDALLVIHENSEVAR